MQTNTENPKTKKNQLSLDFLEEVQSQIGFGEAKTAIIEMYEAAQMSDIFAVTNMQRHNNFQSFKLLYNLFLKLEMLDTPDMTGVNTL